MAPGSSRELNDVPRISFTFACLSSLVLACAAAASAQPANQGVFLDAGAFANAGWHGSSQTSSDGSSPDVNGTAIGGTIAIGTWLTPRFSIRLEAALLGDINDEAIDTDTETSGLGQTIVVTNHESASLRERTVSVLVGYATERRHGVQLCYLGGAVFGFTRTQSSSLELLSPAVITLPSRTTTVRQYGSAAEVGMDADVAIGRHLSVVPQARLVADDVSVRAGIALRARW